MMDSKSQCNSENLLCHNVDRDMEFKSSTHHDETKKMAHDSQIVRAKENLKLSHGWPSCR